MAKFLLYITLTISLLPFLAVSFSPESPTDRRVLVLLDDFAVKSSHSLFFDSLKSRGFELEFKLADDPNIGLQRYGQYLYDALVLFCPSIERFGGSINVASIADFVDSGHDLIIAADTNASDLIREISTESGVDFDENAAAMVIDHTGYAVSNTDGDHTLIATDDLIKSDIILGSKNIEAPVLFQGIGHSVNPANSLVLQVLAASPSAYSANPQSKLTSPPSLTGSAISLVLVIQAYETLEHRLVVAEAAQKLRLPLISKDGEVLEDEIEKWSTMSRSSLDSTSTSVTISSSSNSLSYTSGSMSSTSVANSALNATDAEPGVGGVPNRFLGITPGYLWQTQLQQTPLSMDMAEYQNSVSHEIEARLKSKCEKLADAFIDDIDSSSGSHASSARLPERVKVIIEEIEREEAALQEDLYSADAKFAEYYHVLEQILGVLITLVKDLKLEHQHKYDELQKTWLCKRCETMSAKLRVLEHGLLLATYTQESLPALHKIRKYLVEATEEASVAYNKAVTRLREYQGVDPRFDTIARQYHDIVKKLENMQWTIHQVEMDLHRLPDRSST